MFILRKNMLKIKNWEKFNLYSAKNPRYQKKMTWFKFYGTDYINNIEIHKLSFEQKAILVELWCLGSESDGVLPENFEIAFRLHYPIDFIEKIVGELFARGWLEDYYQSASIEKNKIREREDKIVLDKFNEFWEVWPKGNRKVNRVGCLKLWQSQKLEEIGDKIINHVKIMSDTDWKKDNGQWTPMPATYLRQERFNTDVSPKRKVWEGGV
jgi:hypothetical protein